MAIEEKELSKLSPGIEKQVTFAAAVTLTELAKKSQAESISSIDETFTVRGNWEKPGNRFGVHIETANKANLQSAVKTAASWLIPHETGEDKTPVDGENIAVPTKAIRPVITQKITSAKRPRNINGAVKITTRTGQTSIFKRIARKLVPLYRLVKSARIEKKSTVVEPTIKTVEENLEESFSKNLIKAFKTQK